MYIVVLIMHIVIIAIMQIVIIVIAIVFIIAIIDLSLLSHSPISGGLDRSSKMNRLALVTVCQLHSAFPLPSYKLKPLIQIVPTSLHCHRTWAHVALENARVLRLSILFLQMRVNNLPLMATHWPYHTLFYYQ